MFRKRNYRGLGRLVTVIMILGAVVAYGFNSQHNQSSNPPVANSSLKEKIKPECFELDYQPEDPNPTKVLALAWKITRDNNIINPKTIPPEKELIVKDGDIEYVTSLGEENQGGPWDIAWSHERQKIPPRHGIWCK